MSPDPEKVPVEVEGRNLVLTNLGKVLYPDTGFTKGAVIDYYLRIAPVLLPHIADRPLTLKRYPDGVTGQHFYNKHAPDHRPGWVRTERLPAPGSTSGRDWVRYVIAGDLPTLIWKTARPGDVVVCLGAGNITSWAHALPGQIQQLAAEKAALFADTYSVPPTALPRAWRRVTPSYVAQTLPVFVPTVGEAPHFLYITTDDRPAAFETFLRRHAPVWRYLSSWAVVLVSIALRPTLQATFDRFVTKLASTQPSGRPDMQWYFEKRRLIDNGELAKISVVDLPRFRDLRARFQSRANDALYDDWLRTGSIVADAPRSPTGDSIGTLITDLVPFAYEQFGSLPGVA